ncbi:hypothetical protein NY546_08690 [Curtobacterium flaccumfaciens pv. flaccumfaciens]|uniref:hypothetical protein n=1 Tax=Curtobacterium flaccumfaciens TaxID=2035 RepID=UPI0026583B84|nr:hypothetical protein [Curtobacterium flaccumfaciens]MCS5509367.1 hypothetical protein [Curtobacterium flaccumfaciens pv. flaccumfaciens]MCX2785775.1 hypothetical protein [Curtobacterium flaccumfaciens pv. flaccumfaciens]
MNLSWVNDAISAGLKLSPAERDSALRQGTDHERLLEAIAYPERFNADEETLWEHIVQGGGPWPTLVKESRNWREQHLASVARRIPWWKRSILRTLMGVTIVIPGAVVPLLLLQNHYEEAANLFLLSPSLLATAALVAATRLARAQRWFLRGSLVALGAGYAAYFFTDPKIGAFTAGLSIGGVIFTVLVDACTEQSPSRKRHKRTAIR